MITSSSWRDSQWYYDPHIDQVWYRFTPEEKDDILLLASDTTQGGEPILSSVPEALKRWVFYNRYMLTYYKEIIPEEIIIKLNKIFPEHVGTSRGRKEILCFQKVLVKCIAQMPLQLLTVYFLFSVCVIRIF